MSFSRIIRIIFVLLIFFTGCFFLLKVSFFKNTDELIELPAVEILRPSTTEWAVVIEPYTPFYKEPSASAGIESHARMGDIIEITGKKITNDKLLWYHFKKGWIPKTALSVYSNKLKAEKAAANID